MDKKISILFLFHLFLIFIIKSQENIIVPANMQTIISNIQKKSIDSLYQKDIKIAYYNYLYQCNKLNRINIYGDKLKDLNTYADLHYKLGNISQLEKIQLELIYHEAELSEKNAQNELLISENNLKKYFGKDVDIIPSGELTEKYYSFSFIKNSLASDVDMKNSNLFLTLEIIHNKIVFYENKKLNYVSEIMNTLNNLYSYEDAGLLDVLEILKEAFAIQLEYIEIIKEYNILAIQLLD